MLRRIMRRGGAAATPTAGGTKRAASPDAGAARPAAKKRKAPTAAAAATTAAASTAKEASASESDSESESASGSSEDSDSDSDDNDGSDGSDGSKASDSDNDDPPPPRKTFLSMPAGGAAGTAAVATPAAAATTSASSSSSSDASDDDEPTLPQQPIAQPSDTSSSESSSSDEEDEDEEEEAEKEQTAAVPEAAPKPGSPATEAVIEEDSANAEVDSSDDGLEEIPSVLPAGSVAAVTSADDNEDEDEDEDAKDGEDEVINDKDIKCEVGEEDTDDDDEDEDEDEDKDAEDDEGEDIEDKDIKGEGEGEEEETDDEDKDEDEDEDANKDTPKAPAEVLAETATTEPPAAEPMAEEASTQSPPPEAHPEEAASEGDKQPPTGKRKAAARRKQVAKPSLVGHVLAEGTADQNDETPTATAPALSSSARTPARTKATPASGGPVTPANGGPGRSSPWTGTGSAPRSRGPVGLFSAQEVAVLREMAEAYAAKEGISDADLRQLVHDNAQRHAKFWTEMASFFPGRKRLQVVLRCRRVFPNFAHAYHWTPEQDAELAALVAANGHKWALIGGQLSRSSEDCRKRWEEHVICGDNLLTSYWRFDEERQLARIVGDMLRTIKQENEAKAATAATRTETEPGEETEPDPEPEEGESAAAASIPWLKVSEKMGFTRSGRQCRFKWQQIQDAYHFDADGGMVGPPSPGPDDLLPSQKKAEKQQGAVLTTVHRTTPRLPLLALGRDGEDGRAVPGSGRRITDRTRRQMRVMSHADRYRLVQAIRASNVGREDKIPWTRIPDDNPGFRKRWGRAARELTWKRLKRAVPGYERKPVRAICDALIRDYEADRALGQAWDLDFGGLDSDSDDEANQAPPRARRAASSRNSGPFKSSEHVVDSDLSSADGPDDTVIPATADDALPQRTVNGGGADGHPYVSESEVESTTRSKRGRDDDDDVEDDIEDVEDDDEEGDDVPQRGSRAPSVELGGSGNAVLPNVTPIPPPTPPQLTQSLSPGWETHRPALSAAAAAALKRMGGGAASNGTNGAATGTGIDRFRRATPADKKSSAKKSPAKKKRLLSEAAVGDDIDDDSDGVPARPRQTFLRSNENGAGSNGKGKGKQRALW